MAKIITLIAEAVDRTTLQAKIVLGQFGLYKDQKKVLVKDREGNEYDISSDQHVSDPTNNYAGVTGVQWGGNASNVADALDELLASSPTTTSTARGFVAKGTGADDVTVAQGSNADLTFINVENNTGGVYDGAGIFTADIAGAYLFFASVQFDRAPDAGLSAGTGVVVRYRVNGSFNDFPQAVLTLDPATTYTDTTLEHVRYLYLEVGDTVEVNISNPSGNESLSIDGYQSTYGAYKQAEVVTINNGNGGSTLWKTENGVLKPLDGDNAVDNNGSIFNPDTAGEITEAMANPQSPATIYYDNVTNFDISPYLNGMQYPRTFDGAGSCEIAGATTISIGGGAIATFLGGFNSEAGGAQGHSLLVGSNTGAPLFTLDLTNLPIRVRRLKLQSDVDVTGVGVLYYQELDLNGFTLTGNATQENWYSEVGTPVTPTDISQIESTGIKSGATMGTNADATLWDLGAGEAYVMDYSTPTAITSKLVTWTAQAGLSISNLLTDPRTNVALSLTNISDIGVSFSNSFTADVDGVNTTVYIAEKSSDNFTSEQLRKYAQIGRLVHSNQTNLSFVVPLQRHTESVLSTALTFIDLFPAQNVEGNNFSPTTGVNLSVDKSAGKGFRVGSNYETNLLDPDVQDIPQATPTAHKYRYRNGSGGWTDGTTGSVLDPAQYDDGTGTLDSVTNNRWTAQPVYVFAGSGSMFVQYGQDVFASKSACVEALATLDPVLDPNLTSDAVFRGWFVVRSGGTDTNDSNDFEWRAPLSERGGGTGTPVVVDLQTAYDNSMNPEILTDSSRNALTIKRGSGLDTDNVLEVQNGAGTNTFEVNGNGDSSFAGTVDVSAQLTSNALFKSKGATIIEDSVFQVNKTSAPSITFNNSAGTSAYGLVGEQSGSINLDSYNGLDVELNSDNDVRIGATGDVNVTGNEINLNAPTNVDSDLTANSTTIKTTGGNSTLLVGDDTTTVTNNLTGFRVLARETDGDLYLDHKTKSGKLIRYRCGANSETGFARTFMEVDPTTGDVTFGANVSIGDVLNLATTTNASPTNGDIWYEGSYTTIQQNFKVRSDKPVFEMRSTKNGTWTAGERKGAINFYGSDGSGGGPNVHAFIEAQARDTIGSATELSFGVSDNGSPAVEGLRLKASGVLNYTNAPTSATGLVTGDIWNDNGTLKIV